jgi:hypothetical protein
MEPDRPLLADLRTMWQECDPEPADLAERVLFALSLEDAEFELLTLQESVGLTGARSAKHAEARGTETARSVTFGSESLTVMITLSIQEHQHRIDGWIVPSAALRVELRTSRGPKETTADPTGRFSIDDVPAGLMQLVIHPTEGAVVTLARPVVTPALQL